ncbi:MAG: RrF2 family transcriptional regulator [Pikeienuella sp.]
MQLTARSNYAMRLLMYCALVPERVTPVGEIARAGNMSETHLAKIANDLARLGYLDSVRGRGGGIRLARPAAEINLGEIVRATELGRCLVECFDPETNTCPLTAACRFRTILGHAFDAFLAVLDGYTLADLVSERQRLADLLGLSTAAVPAPVA